MRRCICAIAAVACAQWLSFALAGTAAAGPGEYCQLQPRPPSCDSDLPVRPGSGTGPPGISSGGSAATYAPWTTAAPQAPATIGPRVTSPANPQQPIRAGAPERQNGSSRGS